MTVPFAQIAASSIESALREVARQYLVGRLSQTQTLQHIYDADIEIGISDYRHSAVELAHRHIQAKEYQLVLKGMTEYRDLDTRQVHRYVCGDFFVIYPGTSYLQRVKRDTRILFVKYPAGDDKHLVEVDAEALAWAQKPLRVKRLDMAAGKETPAPNSMKPAVAVLDIEGRLLLLRRRDSGLWAMPGGTLELNENIETCAKREVREETGIEIEVTGIIGTYTDPATIIAYSDGEIRRECSTLLAASAATDELTVDEESSEASWVNITCLHEYEMSHSQRRRVEDAVTHRGTGTIFIR
jgi:8-oxo-dGTP diphosphatase